MANCLICKRVLNNPADPLSVDCGGDCLKCMADCDDPDAVAAIERLKSEGKIPADPSDHEEVDMSNVSDIGNADLKHILAKARDAAAGGVNAMSTGEALASALVLNRPDWLAAMNYTIAEAIDRVGPEWSRLIPAAARQFERDSQEAAYAAAEQARQAKLKQFATQQGADEEMEFSAKLVTYGDAPGYRDVRLTLDLEPIGEGQTVIVRACIRIGPKDGEDIARYIAGVHRFAWDRSGGRPIDAKPDELRPRWLDRELT